MLRPLLHFLWIGWALFALDRWLAPAPPSQPVVIDGERVDELRGAFLARAGRLPDAAELRGLVRAEVDDELLYREARRLGFDRDDPVVQRRLVQNMRFAGADPERDAASLYLEALDLGMHESDPVVRRRLIQRMRLAIEAPALRAEVTQEELAAHYAAHLNEYRQAARLRLVQLYFDGEPEGEASEVLAGLRAAGAGPEAGRDRGDPFLYGAEQPSQSRRELAGRFGPDFAREVFALPVGTWSGPVASSYGRHLVWIRGHAPERQRSLEEVRDEVRHAVLALRRRRALDAALARLRADVPVEVAGS